MSTHRKLAHPTATWGRRRRLGVVGSTALAALSAAPGVRAQPAAAPPGSAASVPARPGASADFETVTITARKRQETLTQTPAAISVFSTQDMDERNIGSLYDIGKYTPNVDINNFGAGNPAHAAIFIRGIGLQDHIITTDPGVGVYLDGVYLGRQMGANLGLSNISRVEVLRGPQGTLYGKNSIGGAINVITIQPGDEELKRVDLKFGSRGRVQADLYGNTTVNDALAISASADVNRRNGVGKALLVDAPKDIGEIFQYSGRVAAKLKVSNDFSLLGTIDGVRGNNGKSPSTIDIFDPAAAAGFGLTQAQVSSNPDNSNSGERALFRQTNAGIGGSLTAAWTIDSHLSAKVLTGWRYSSYRGGLDDDNVLAVLETFPEHGSARQISVEPQLNGEYGRLDFVTGLYYGRETGNTNSGPWFFGASTGPGLFFDINQVTKSTAAYGHVGYKLTDDLKLAGGMRYSHDAKDADALFDNWNPAVRAYRSKSWSALTGDISLGYDITKRISTYATVSTGYQAGGYPPRPFGGASTFVSFDQTKATNVEAGLKGVFLENLLQANLAVFHTTYRDLPLQVSLPDPALGFVTLFQSAEAVSKGIELDGTLKLSPIFSLQSAIGYLHSRVTSVPASSPNIKVGFTPALTPTWTVSVSPIARFAIEGRGTVDARIDYSFRGGMWGQAANNDQNRIAGRSLVGFNIAYAPQGSAWTGSVYGQNIFNKVYDVGRIDGDGPGYTAVIRSNDRSEFGVKLSYVF